MDLLDSCLDKLILDAKENVAAQTKPKGLVFAIDFGTTYSGVAFTRTPVYIPDDNSNDVAQLNDLKDLDRAVDVVRTWPMPDYTCVEKTPTVLAYSGNQVDGYKLESWGGKAKNSSNIRIEYFKLGLRDKPTEKFSQTASGGFILHGFATDPTWRHPNFPDLSALDYTTAFLTKLYRYVLEEVIPLQFGTEFLSKHPIYIVLTVPAIWSETAKNLTRTAAILAGIPKQRLELITEPEAAALYCATMVEQVDLKEGDCFVVCDAGGGTVDLISYRVSSPDPFTVLQEGAIGTGGSCGAVSLGKHFEEFLYQRFEKLAPDALEAQYISRAVDEFNSRVKMYFNPYDDSLCSDVQLPIFGAPSCPQVGLEYGYLKIAE